MRCFLRVHKLAHVSYILARMKIYGHKIADAKLEEIRFASVKAVQDGKTPSETARWLGATSIREAGEVSRWQGWDVLRSRKASGRPKSLSTRQIRWLYEMVTMKARAGEAAGYAVNERPDQGAQSVASGCEAQHHLRGAVD